MIRVEGEHVGGGLVVKPSCRNREQAVVKIVLHDSVAYLTRLEAEHLRDLLNEALS